MRSLSFSYKHVWHIFQFHPVFCCQVANIYFIQYFVVQVANIYVIQSFVVQVANIYLIQSFVEQCHWQTYISSSLLLNTVIGKPFIGVENRNDNPPRVCFFLQLGFFRLILPQLWYSFSTFYINPPFTPPSQSATLHNFLCSLSSFNLILQSKCQARNLWIWYSSSSWLLSSYNVTTASIHFRK